MQARPSGPATHLPRAGEFLLWPPTIQPWDYRIVDRLFAHQLVRRGRPKPWSRTEEIAPVYLAAGGEHDIAALMERNLLAGLLVIHDGRIRLERYGLRLSEADRWSTMSTVKSLTALLVGGAIHDGAIASVQVREDWNRPGTVEGVLPCFADWNFGWLDMPTLIRAAEVVYDFPMVDRDPLPGWTHGRVTLLGNAAHPMYPIDSNGASQAILDARFLALQLATQPGIGAALAAYEASRRPATAAVVEANRRDGPDRVMDLVHTRAPASFDRLEDVVPQAELAAVVMGYKRIAGFDPETLNRRESWSVPGAA